MRTVTRRPARKIKPSRRSITGWAKCRDGSSIPFESALERDWIIALDFEPLTRSIHSQPFTLEYYSPEGKRRYYTPDFLATFDHCWEPHLLGYVYEVKYRDDLRENWKEYRPKFKAAIRRCREEGLKFKIVTDREIRTPFVQSATFLRRYREYPTDEAVDTQLKRTLLTLPPDHRTPKILLTAAYAYEPNRIKAISHLWRLIDAHAILFDRDEPLTMNSEIWLQEE